MARSARRLLAIHDPPILVVMAKAPVCGAVKTRLGKEIGGVKAAALASTLAGKLLREAGKDPRFRTVLAITPDQASHAYFAAWRLLPLRKRAGGAAPHPVLLPKGRRDAVSPSSPPVRGDSLCLKRIPQGRGSLGQRMQRIFDRCGRGPLIIVGTDIPFITREIIADAFRKLRGADAVFGRAEDGGYWLVGMRRRAKRLAPFQNVRWSSPHALADTLKNVRPHRVAFAATLFDIDTEADYRRYLRERYR